MAAERIASLAAADSGEDILDADAATERTGEIAARRRFHVVGASGAGKSTFARRLASLLGSRHVEFDALYWGPGWSRPNAEAFCARVLDEAAAPSWVMDGNVGIATDRVFPRADVVVWLDYPVWTVATRITRRTVRRLWSREELWNGNRERLRNVLGRQSPIVWALRTHARARRSFRELASGPGPVVVRLRSPREADDFLAALRASRPAGAAAA